ncbi:bioH protein, partial [Pseudomonas syringae pv. actinidiae ICMP 19079]
HSSKTALVDGLKILQQLDTRSALQTYRGPQLHLFAGLDAFVPAEAAGDLLALLPDVEVGLIEQAGHAFLLENPH